MTTAELLASSLAAHLRYREARIHGDKIAARAALVEAEQLRLRAQEVDPEHVDPIWAQSERTHPHDALVTFYAEQLAR